MFRVLINNNNRCITLVVPALGGATRRGERLDGTYVPGFRTEFVTFSDAATRYLPRAARHPSLLVTNTPEQEGEGEGEGAGGNRDEGRARSLQSDRHAGSYRPERSILGRGRLSIHTAVIFSLDFYGLNELNSCLLLVST